MATGIPDINTVTARDRTVYPIYQLKLVFADIAIIYDSLTFAWYSNLSAFNKLYYLLRVLPHGPHTLFLNSLCVSAYKSLIFHSDLYEQQRAIQADFVWALHELVISGDLHLQPLEHLQESVQTFANRVRAFRDSILDTLELITIHYRHLGLDTVTHHITSYILLIHAVLDPLDYTLVEQQAGPRRLVIGPAPDHELQLEVIDN
jgi:hypothetical protein